MEATAPPGQSEEKTSEIARATMPSSSLWIYRAFAR